MRNYIIEFSALGWLVLFDLFKKLKHSLIIYLGEGHMKKKIAIILAFCMVITCFSGIAIAKDINNSTSNNSTSENTTKSDDSLDINKSDKDSHNKEESDYDDSKNHKSDKECADKDESDSDSDTKNHDDKKIMLMQSLFLNLILSQ